MEKTEALQTLKVFVSAYLPFRLEECFCHVKVEGKIVGLDISNPEQPFLNPDGLLSDDLGRLWSFKETRFRAEPARLFSSIATSEIKFSDFDANQLDENSTKSIVRKVKKTLQKEILPAMNKLVDSIRLENNAPFLPPIRIFHLRIEAVGLTEPFIHEVNQKFRQWLRGDGESVPWYRRFPWSKYVHKTMTYQVPDEKLLITDTSFETDSFLFANAEHLFSLGQYSSAVVMAHSAVDAMVSAFISIQFELKGVGKKDTDSFLINNGLPNKLDLVLKLLFDFNIKNDNKLWASFSNMNSLRNDIVHRGMSANDKDAEEMIEISRKIIGLVKKFVTDFPKKAG